MARRAGLPEDYFEITQAVTEKAGEKLHSGDQSIWQKTREKSSASCVELILRLGGIFWPLPRLAEIEFGIRHKNWTERTATSSRSGRA